MNMASDKDFVNFVLDQIEDAAEAGRAFIGNMLEAPPYKGTKPKKKKA